MTDTPYNPDADPDLGTQHPQDEAVPPGTDPEPDQAVPDDAPTEGDDDG